MRRLLLLLPLGLGLGALVSGGKALSQQGVPPAPSPWATQPTLPPGASPIVISPAAGIATSARSLPASALPAGALPAGPLADASPAPLPNPFPIARDAGEWVICAAHYSGSDAPELSRQVAVELRDKHRLSAYIYDYAERERERERERLLRLKAEFEAKYPGAPFRKRAARIPEQRAVLVGGFRDFTHASAYLPTFKALPMPKLELPGDKCPYDRLTIFEPDPQSRTTIVRPVSISPFSTAMVVHNPAIPQPPKVQPKFDPLWKKFNANEDYSLLRNSHRYTLVVKEYTGSFIVPSQGKVSELLMSFGLGNDSLSASAQQAHNVAEFLRDRRIGLDTYVLHTKTASIVTVGGFDSLDGPEIKRMQQRLATLKLKTKDGNDPIGLMSRPIPMEVPRP